MELTMINLGATREQQTEYINTIIDAIYELCNYYRIPRGMVDVYELCIQILYDHKFISDEYDDILRRLIMKPKLVDGKSLDRYKDIKRFKRICSEHMPQIGLPILTLYLEFSDDHRRYLYDQGLRKDKMGYATLKALRVTNMIKKQIIQWELMLLMRDQTLYFHYLPRDLLQHYISPMCKI